MKIVQMYGQGAAGQEPIAPRTMPSAVAGLEAAIEAAVAAAGVGTNGKSAYELAVEAGFVGTVAEWLTSLHGADGAAGRDGSDGAAGRDGLTTSVNGVPQVNGNVQLTAADLGIPLTQCGATEVTVAASSVAGFPIAFPVAFGDAPIVVATVIAANASLFNVTVTSVTASGCTLRVSSAYTASSKFSIHWIAMERGDG